MDTIKILIADDHAVVREGTREILEQEQDIEIIAEAADGEEAVRLTGISRPDVVIMDIAMPEMDGIEATKQIKDRFPATAILILTAYDDDQFVFGLLEAGAAGYLLKTVRGKELIDAVKRIYAGESVLHPVIARKVLNHFIVSNDAPVKHQTTGSLSEREMEVLKLAAKGIGNQDIAHELALSAHTVQAHLTHIFTKLQVGSRTEAVVHALKAGWISFEEVG